MRPIAIALILMTSAASAAGPHDGVYTGTRHLTLTNNTAPCDRTEATHARIVVRNNHFRIWWRQEAVDVAVNPDGSFERFQNYQNFRVSPALLKIGGQVRDNMLEARVGTERCAYRISLERQ